MQSHMHACVPACIHAYTIIIMHGKVVTIIIFEDLVNVIQFGYIVLWIDSEV